MPSCRHDRHRDVFSSGVSEQGAEFISEEKLVFLTDDYLRRSGDRSNPCPVVILRLKAGRKRVRVRPRMVALIVLNRAGVTCFNDLIVVNLAVSDNLVQCSILFGT